MHVASRAIYILQMEDWVDAGALSGGRSRPGHGDDNVNGEGEEDTQGSETGSRKGKRTKDGKGKGKATADGKGKGIGKGKGNRNGNGIVKQTPIGDDISCAVRWQ
jgi:hypothetical protein